MVENLLSFADSLGKEDSGLNRMLSNACLMRKEEAVCAVEDCHGYVLGIVAGGRQILINHRLHYLALKVDRHSGHVGRLDHPLLSDHELLWWQFMAKFVSDNDNAACVLEDSLELVHCFEIVNFCEDSDLVSSFCKCVFDLLHIFDRSYIWYHDVIEVVLDGHSDDIVFVIIL